MRPLLVLLLVASGQALATPLVVVEQGQGQARIGVQSMIRASDDQI